MHRLARLSPTLLVIASLGCSPVALTPEQDTRLRSIEETCKAAKQVSEQNQALLRELVGDAYGRTANAAPPSVLTPEDAPDPDAEQIYRVPVGDAPSSGPADGKVTIVVFSDFQCPFCGRGNETLNEIKKTWPKEVRVVFKHFPLEFHDQAMPAAMAAEAARLQNRFWEMHDCLFANQGSLGPKQIDECAQGARLDMKRFAQDKKSKNLEQRVKAQEAEGTRVGVTGTPTFFVNGRRLQGAQAIEAFKEAIELGIKRADALLQSGVSRDQLYDRLTASAN